MPIVQKEDTPLGPEEKSIDRRKSLPPPLYAPE